MAVLAVILFHAGFQGFRGGYVGVDVFFVISGYLITTLITAELDSDRFSLSLFYERRARRILPALVFVVIAMAPGAWLCLTPAELKEFSASVVAVSTFWSNVFFWRQTGYFDAAAELKPLLHTWSLSLEEQYYIVFPLFLWALSRFARRWRVHAVALVAVLSFAIAQWGVLGRRSAAFFLLPTRGWELLVGALAALHVARGARRPAGQLSSQLGTACGILMIACCIVAFDDRTAVPGAPAILPTMGTALVILFGTPSAGVTRLLSSRPLVGIGLMSYSAYLLHQPVFALIRNRFGEPSRALALSLCVITLAGAYLSWRYVERPFRSSRQIERRTLVQLAFGGTAALVLGALVVHGHDGYPGRLPSGLRWESLGQRVEAVGDVCERTPVREYPGVRACFFGDTAAATTVALYGDSHADALSYELDRQFKRLRVRGVRVAADDCQVVPHVFDSRAATPSKAARCSASYRSLTSYLAASDVTAVVVTSRWTFRLFPIQGEIETATFDNGEGGLERGSGIEWVALDRSGRFSPSAEVKREALERLVDSLAGTGKRVVLVYPIPELGWDIAALNHWRTDGRPPQVSTSYAVYRRRNRFVLNSFDRLPKRPNVATIRADSAFCSPVSGRCLGQSGGAPLYLDDNHLSDEGARLLMPDLLRSAGVGGR